jgi:phage N-6-adenine-methyltransferase
VNHALMFSKASDEWETPEGFFLPLQWEFSFDVDVAASDDNAKVRPYFGGVKSSLEIDWALFGRRPPTCWLNPPYSKCREFIAKAAHEARRGCTVVALVPSRTDTRWWHEHVWDAEKHQPRPGVEIRFIKGRLKFGEGKNSAPFPSVVVIFRPPADPEAGTDTQGEK